jgi:hypothetical protein
VFAGSAQLLRLVEIFEELLRGVVAGGVGDAAARVDTGPAKVEAAWIS